MNEWRYIYASVQGTSHIRTTQPCQDSSVVQEIPTQAGFVLFLACSDGAGSASRSEMGSRVACATLLDEVTRYYEDGGATGSITRDHATAWLSAIQQKLEVQAAAMDVSSREVACTLVAAIIDQSSCAFLQIGDGAIVISEDSQDYRVVFWPDRGEYANTTFFVTAPDAVARLKVDVQDTPMSDVCVMTDGLQSLALHYQSNSAHAPFFRPMLNALQADADILTLTESLIGFLNSERINERTDDDKTLVLATRVSRSTPA